jgi:DNA repair protein RadC
LNTYNYKIPINQWAEEDKPREKLISKGRSALSDAELIGILLSSGNRDMSAVDLGKVILNFVNNDLNELAKLSVKDLEKFKGIGEAKAISIISALELGRRRKNTETPTKPKLQSSNQVYELMKPVLLDLEHEEFWVIFMNQSGALIKYERISTGGVSGTVVDVRMIMKSAIEVLASSIILVHNHPSGNLKASVQDERITKQMIEAGKFMQISIADHLIFSNTGYLSFRDEGLI